jgi:glycosyltransferase involved in cell wall biosynthesis
LSEGFGLPGIEAMVHGAPVVSSSFTCLPEIYGNAAEYFDPLDEEDIAKEVLGVIKSESKRKKLIEAGHIQAKKYSWKKMANETLEIYKNAISGSSLK